jgi:hypothetical protein
VARPKLLAFKRFESFLALHPASAMASHLGQASPQLLQVQDQLFGTFVLHLRAHAYKLLQLGFEDDRLTYEGVGDVLLCRHVDALGVIAAHDLQTIVERICDWRVTEPMSPQVPEHSKLDAKLQHDLGITAEKRRQLILDYLFASVLHVLLSSYVYFVRRDPYFPP